jgi:hypothetical protein
LIVEGSIQRLVWQTSLQQELVQLWIGQIVQLTALFAPFSKSLISPMDRKEPKSVKEFRRKKRVRRNRGLPSRSISFSFRLSRNTATWRQWCKASATSGAAETVAPVGGGGKADWRAKAAVTCFSGSPPEGFLQIGGLLELWN